MLRKLGAGLLIVLLLGGCMVRNEATVHALQTRVAELQAKIAPDSSEPVPTSTAPKIALSEVPASIAANRDENAFCADLAALLEANDWTIREVYDGGLNVESPTGRIYLLQYKYSNKEVSRLLLFSLWAGVGESNVECEALTAINQVNNDYDLAKVSVDVDGDVWIETVYPVGRALNGADLLAYLEWFEESESTLVLDALADYMQ
jgi:outer membrane murein-binding lipoprotein Lpp